MIEPVRILHTISTLEIGGEQRYLARICAGLDRRRFLQTVIYWGSDALAQEFPADVKLRRLALQRPTARRPADWLLPRLVAGILAETQADLVTTHGAGIVQIAAAAAAKVHRVPVVHTIQRPYGNRAPTEDVVIRTPGLRQLVYGLTDRFVALGRYYRRDQIDRWKIPARKIYFNYIGIDLDAVRPDPSARAAVRAELRLPEDAPLLGVVARHVPKKGVGRGIACFAALVREVPQARLLLVGDGPTRAAHEADVGDRGLKGSVLFLGARADGARLMSACDAFLQTTENPLNGISSIEAMAVGRPVITVADGPEEEKMAADTCETDENGLYFRTDRAAESVTELAALLRNPARLEAMGRASRRMAEERFDIRRHIASLEHLYRSLIEGKSPT